MRGADGLLVDSPKCYSDQNNTHSKNASRPSQQIHIDHWQQRYLAVRQRSIQLCQNLTPADHELQAAAFTSPVKWHLAHTSWFFETFILSQQTNYRAFHPQYEVLFNSYYNGVGEQFPRHQRGLLSRPSLAEVIQYRQHVDHHVQQWLAQRSDVASLSLLELGLNHEQQHQELLLTDLLYSWSHNPLAPVYKPLSAKQTTKRPSTGPIQYCTIAQGCYTLGHTDNAFHFDNETPAHQQLINNFQIATHAVNNRDYLAFMREDGYQRPELWLADGWNWVQQEKIIAPLYWQKTNAGWRRYSLQGWQDIDDNDLVRHISFYEADAFARWSNQRLPTEFEWEVAYRNHRHQDGVFIEHSGLLTSHPTCGDIHAKNSDTAASSTSQATSTADITDALDHNENKSLNGMLGNTWEWTSSPYSPYPGYQPAAGAVGEYNGKFMCNQMVLRGGSCLTPRDHIRPSYRNFFYPHERWQMTGIRLAK